MFVDYIKSEMCCGAKEQHILYQFEFSKICANPYFSQGSVYIPLKKSGESLQNHCYLWLDERREQETSCQALVGSFSDIRLTWQTYSNWALIVPLEKPIL